MNIIRSREDENICRQCSELKEGDCNCLCVDCGKNLWPSSRCEDCQSQRSIAEVHAEDIAYARIWGD